MTKQLVIQVFEHQKLLLDHFYNGVMFKEYHFDALVKLNDLHRGKYFEVIHKGIRFSSYVGVLQIDNLLIEILPKVEGYTFAQNQWRNVLIEMLKVTKGLQVEKVGEAQVSKQNIHLLDIYFDWFLREMEGLIKSGLIKQYYNETKNVNSLKGKLHFVEHLKHNLVHKERFFTTHQVYGKDHLFHQILAQALQIVEKLSDGTYHFARCKSIALDFPVVKLAKATESTFKRLNFNRKNAPYRTALSIARLIILNYSPNIKSGSENMLALLFDMNELWEQYILVKLRHNTVDWQVEGQQTKRFWENKTIRPDIVLTHKAKGDVAIIDTKWKNYSYQSISLNDLRQIYVYNDFWKANIGILLYPNSQKGTEILKGKYHHREYIGKIGLISVLDDSGNLNKGIANDILDMLK